MISEAFKGFPRAALNLMRCPADQGELFIESSSQWIFSGAVRCRTCSGVAPIENGVLDFLTSDSLDSESRRELAIREREWAGDQIALTDEDLAEMEPHIEALALRRDSRLLEFGCGTGRFTCQLANNCALLVAVDFSQVALNTIARAAPGDNVALVRADLSYFAVAPKSFDSVLSTLTSNLPYAERRRRLYGLAGEALVDKGVFVSGTHYYGFRARLTGVAKEGFYNDGGIYRFYTTREDVRREMSEYFHELRIQPVQILLGMARRIRISPHRVSRLFERVPVIRELGSLLMTVARRPKRASL